MVAGVELRLVAALVCSLAVACTGGEVDEPAAPGPVLDAGADALDAPAADSPTGDAGSNVAPVADAGSDQLGAVALALRLDGRGSSDPDGDALGFAWAWSSRPANSAAVLADADTARPSFVPDVAGQYVAELVVNDGQVASPPDQARIDVRATGGFVPFFGGTGEIPDVVSGQTIEVPLEQRVHLWVLPEGYLKSDLAKFDSDVVQWWKDVLAIDVYAAFKEAFVVWKLPVASAEHVTLSTPQSANTAFEVPLTSAGSVSPSIPPNGPTAGRVWSYMAEFPFPATDFYPAVGVTASQAKGIVAAVLIYDPQKGQSGYSGVSRRLENPASSSQKLSVAIARNTTHELTHALARLADEYVVAGSNFGSDASKMSKSAYLSNVVTDPHCDALPWKHLLDGSAINPGTKGLVGAFGSAQAGYHSELKCLMNGSHDNATIFGGNGSLRTNDRLCNFCREITAFRIYERTRVLPDSETSLQTWTQSHRSPFFEFLGFTTPSPVPQQNDQGTSFYHPCLP